MWHTFYDTTGVSMRRGKKKINGAYIQTKVEFLLHKTIYMYKCKPVCSLLVPTILFPS